MSELERKEYVFSQLKSLPNAFQYVTVTDYIKDIEKENQQLKSQLKQKDEVIEKIKKRCNQEISASSYQYEQRHKQQDLVYKVAHERILKMLGDSNE